MFVHSVKLDQYLKVLICLDFVIINIIKIAADCYKFGLFGMILVTIFIYP